MSKNADMVARLSLLRAAEAWTHKDSWGVEVISLDTLGMLHNRLSAGATVEQLRAHAQHVGVDCCFLSGVETMKTRTEYV